MPGLSRAINYLVSLSEKKEPMTECINNDGFWEELNRRKKKMPDDLSRVAEQCIEEWVAEQLAEEKARYCAYCGSAFEIGALSCNHCGAAKQKGQSNGR